MLIMKALELPNRGGKFYYGGEMCGRYSLTSPPEAMYLLFGLRELTNLAPRYNIAPSQDVPVVRTGENGVRELAMLHWGLIPSWAKQRDFGAKTINARAETVAEKPSFRAAFKKRRCLIPADGYYEWVKVGGGKQPYRFSRKDGGVFALAGLWEHWQDPADGETVESCSIIVREAGPMTAPLHHRMPAIVPPEQFELWLGESGADQTEVAAVLGTPNEDGLKVYPVSKRVNSPRNDDPGCIEALDEAQEDDAGTQDDEAPPPAQGNLF